MSQECHVLNRFSFSLFTDTYSPGHTPLIVGYSTHLVSVVLVVTCGAVSHDREVSLWLSLTQVEVVVLGVTDEDEAADQMGES
jgi:hypothetical protein